MPTPEPEPTRELPSQLGAFAITGILGEGGSAVVYAARHQGEDVALKVPRERELTPREQERFLEEAKMLERVRHRSVVEVLGSGRLPDGQPYLLMRRYEGETVADHLATRGALPVDRAVGLFLDLAAAIEALHDAGLLHRDLKPENVLLVDGGRSLKLLDFGIAKEIDAPASTTTQAGIARGTPATMAPERFFGAPASKSTDVYELAVVLYAMLVGRLPWPDVTNVQARLNPLSPLEAGAPVSESLSNAVMQALSTRPERRPAGVAELVAAVRAGATADMAVPGRVTAATVMSTPPLATEDAQVIESRREPKRAAGLWLAASAVLVLAIAAVTLGAVMSHSTAPTPPTSAAPLEPPNAPREPAAAPVAPETAKEPAAEPSSSTPARGPGASTHAPAGQAASAQAPPSSSAPGGKPPAKGKPKGAPCTRSSECASMVCAAETCQ